MRLSFRVSVCAACFPVRYCPSRRFPLPVTRLIRKRPFFFFPPEHVLQRYFRALFANTWLPSDALPAYLSTIAPSPSVAPTRAFKRTCYRLPMRFCRSSKGLDRVAFFDAHGLFSIPAVLVTETDPLPCCWPIASGIASSSSSRTSICELSFRCEPGCDPRSRCLSQMLHLVLAYALPLTSTCSCILSQAIRLNGLLVVSRFGRFPGRSTLCFDFCSDVFFGFRSFASVP